MERSFPIITKENAHCLDCYRCLRKCAIDAIDFSTGRAQIIQDKCVLCGECVSECPQKTKKIITDKQRVIEALETDKPLALSIGGMVVSFFQCMDPESIIEKAYQIGFSFVETVDVIEPVVMGEISSYIRKHDDQFFISSHCPTIVNLIEKHYNHLIPHLLPFPSLAKIHANEIRQKYPDYEIVYVTACPGEFNNPDIVDSVDYIITFLDFEQLLKYMKKKSDEVPSGILAPYRGGYSFTVIGNMATQLLRNGVLREGYIEWYSGLDNCINILNGLKEDDLPDVDFLELMSCSSGCVSGLDLEKRGSILDRCLCLERYYHSREERPVRILESKIGKREFCARPYEEPDVSLDEVAKEMRTFYEQAGTKILNCGACGFDSCYEKSAAVVRGQAERNMCISYMKAKAETLANGIVNTSESGVIVFDNKMRILQTNPRAHEILSGYDLKDGNVLTDYIDSRKLNRVVYDGKIIHNQLYHYQELNIWTQETIQPMEGMPGHFLMTIRDFTEQIKQKQELEAVKKQLLIKASEVINDQMRIAQEIASLLGETTAQTKITLLQLINEFEQEKELT